MKGSANAVRHPHPNLPPSRGGAHRCPELSPIQAIPHFKEFAPLAQAVRKPERVVVAHYINPPHLVPLVEIVRGEHTSDETVAALHGLLKKVGKSPVVVQKELPGFISGRLQMVVLKEALWLVQNGFASPQDVDFVLKSSGPTSLK